MIRLLPAKSVSSESDLHIDLIKLELHYWVRGHLKAGQAVSGIRSKHVELRRIALWLFFGLLLLSSPCGESAAAVASPDPFSTLVGVQGSVCPRIGRHV